MKIAFPEIADKALLVENGTLLQKTSIAIVGCGGTGSFLAENLCRLLIGTPSELVLIDPDTVEQHNLLRQNFTKADIGKNKARTLAERLADKYDRTVGYLADRFPDNNQSAQHTSLNQRPPTLIIGCVDNGAAREAIMAWQKSHGKSWWLDSGNDKDFGQVLLGNTGWKPLNTRQLLSPDKEPEWTCLPSPLVQRPDLQFAKSETSADMDCARAVLLQEQDPTINTAMAALTTAVIYKLLTGKCRTIAHYIDLNTGTMSSVPATQNQVARIYAAYQEEKIEK